MSTYAIIDFETTGLSPSCGDRATEVAAVILENGNIVDRYQSLMNPGIPVPAFIQSYTGITDEMVRQAPLPSIVMQELNQVLQGVPLVAHNASFDQKFLDAEYQRTGLKRDTEFTCSMLLARRVYPNFSSHKLGALVSQLDLPTTGTYHRAMADAEMTAHLLVHMIHELNSYGLETVNHELLCELQGIPKSTVSRFIARQAR